MARELSGLRGLSGLLVCVLSALTPAAAWAQVDFVRGDANADGLVDISDGIVNLGYQFLGDPAPACLDAADVDGLEVVEEGASLHPALCAVCGFREKAVGGALVRARELADRAGKVSRPVR